MLLWSLWNLRNIPCGLPAAGSAAACLISELTSRLSLVQSALFWIDGFSSSQLRCNVMAEVADTGVSSRAERKALEKAQNTAAGEREEDLPTGKTRNQQVDGSYLRAGWLTTAAHHCVCSPERVWSVHYRWVESWRNLRPERSEEEAAVLLLHTDTAEELSRRQVRSRVLKRKQEEVRPRDWLHGAGLESAQGDVRDRTTFGLVWRTEATPSSFSDFSTSRKHEWVCLQFNKQVYE